MKHHQWPKSCTCLPNSQQQIIEFSKIGNDPLIQELRSTIQTSKRVAQENQDKPSAAVKCQKTTNRPTNLSESLPLIQHNSFMDSTHFICDGCQKIDFDKIFQVKNIGRKKRPRSGNPMHSLSYTNSMSKCVLCKLFERMKYNDFYIPDS